MSVPAANALSPAPVITTTLASRVLANPPADFGQALVHGESQRIARLRAVEGDPGDIAALVVEQFFGHFIS